MPVFADFRGRLYPNCSFLSYQGNQLYAAMLELFEGEALTEEGVRYFLIYGANVYGLDKLSFKERYDWVLENASLILNLDMDFIRGAADVISFVNFALNFRKWYTNPTAKIHMFINQDATCSGLQHIASLLADQNLAQNVNVTGEAENAGDVYQDIANKVASVPMPGVLAYLDITRSLVKRPVMTLPYGVTKLGMADQIKGRALAKITKDKEVLFIFPAKAGTPAAFLHSAGNVALTPQDISNLVKVLWDTINTSYVAIYELKEAVQGLARVMTKLNAPIAWVAPSGLNITQHYLQSTEDRIVTYQGGKRTKFVVHNYEKDTFNASKQANSLMPNFVHSFDSSLVVKLLASTEFNVITIHDCFGCHPNHMGLLRQIIFTVFADMYLTKNHLQEFFDHNIRHLKESGVTITKAAGSIFATDPLTGIEYELPNIPAGRVCGPSPAGPSQTSLTWLARMLAILTAPNG
uniref:DNA-directed RNA polymerase n=1 Tax=Powellomyces hirtus TaxID=109895 RepID=A0A4P8NPC2_9FUNG|nr:DNA-dependent RNA polymerase [Powellomyces hirtus]